MIFLTINYAIIKWLIPNLYPPLKFLYEASRFVPLACGMDAPARGFWLTWWCWRHCVQCSACICCSVIKSNMCAA